MAARVEAGLVPILKAYPGFRGYYLVNCGNDTITSVSMFDSPEAALASGHEAAAWVRANIDEAQTPEVTGGEVMLGVPG